MTKSHRFVCVCRMRMVMMLRIVIGLKPLLLKNIKLYIKKNVSRELTVRVQRRWLNGRKSNTDEIDSQIAAELRTLNKANVEEEKIDPECAARGRLVTSEMQAMSPEHRGALKAELIRVFAKFFP